LKYLGFKKRKEKRWMGNEMEGKLLAVISSRTEREGKRGKNEKE